MKPAVLLLSSSPASAGSGLIATFSSSGRKGENRICAVVTRMSIMQNAFYHLKALISTVKQEIAFCILCVFARNKSAVFSETGK